MPGHTARNQLHGMRNLFGRGYGGVLNLAACTNDATAFGKAVFGLNLRPMTFDHKVNAIGAVAFFARFRQKDHIPIQRDFHALKLEHGHQPRRHAGLVIQRAAPVDIAAFARCGKWRMLPLGGINGDDIRVAHNQHGALLAAAAQTGYEIGALRIERENFRLDAFAIEHAFQIIHYQLFIARRIARVKA